MLRRWFQSPGAWTSYRRSRCSTWCWRNFLHTEKRKIKTQKYLWVFNAVLTNRHFTANQRQYHLRPCYMITENWGPGTALRRTRCKSPAESQVQSLASCSPVSPLLCPEQEAESSGRSSHRTDFLFHQWQFERVSVTKPPTEKTNAIRSHWHRRFTSASRNKSVVLPSLQWHTMTTGGSGESITALSSALNHRLFFKYK